MNTYKVVSTGYCKATVKFEDGGELTGTKHVYNFPMIGVTVDLIVFSEDLTHVLLVRRSAKTEPAEFRNMWAVPGGFLNPNESALEGACREYKEETGCVAGDEIFFVTVATDPKRDSRQRTVSNVYTAKSHMDPSKLMNPEDTEEIAGVRWVNVNDILTNKTPLAFDHANLVYKAHALHTVINCMSPDELARYKHLQMILSS